MCKQQLNSSASATVWTDQSVCSDPPIPSLAVFILFGQCNAENTELKSEQPVMRYMAQTFSVWVFTMEVALGGF